MLQFAYSVPSGLWAERAHTLLSTRPALQYLTMGSATPCLRFGYDQQKTHRCTRCPWWRCSDDSCVGAAWDDSPGSVDRWNWCAGTTYSRILDPVRSEEKPFVYWRCRRLHGGGRRLLGFLFGV